MEGEHLVALRSWLDERLGAQAVFDVQLIQGGRSNLSYRVVHGPDRFVLRRPPHGTALEGAHDVLREFRLLENLVGSGVPIAPPVAACDETDVIGAPFTLVGLLDGLALRTGDELGELHADARSKVVSSFGEALAQLHLVDPERVGRPRATGQDHAARQFRVWNRQLTAEPTRPLPLLDALGEHLAARQFQQRHVSIVHGDYRLDNVLIARDGSVAGVIDWELWTVGDPIIDLGSALAYWTESLFELFPLGASPTASGVLGGRRDVLEAYLAAGGPVPETDELDWAISFGLWRFAVILEGVYRRNLAGAYGSDAADDWERFAHVVPALAEVGWQVRPR